MFCIKNLKVIEALLTSQNWSRWSRSFPSLFPSLSKKLYKFLKAQLSLTISQKRNNLFSLLSPPPLSPFPADGVSSWVFRGFLTKVVCTHTFLSGFYQKPHSVSFQLSGVVRFSWNRQYLARQPDPNVLLPASISCPSPGNLACHQVRGFGYWGWWLLWLAGELCCLFVWVWGRGWDQVVEEL